MNGFRSIQICTFESFNQRMFKECLTSLLTIQFQSLLKNINTRNIDKKIKMEIFFIAKLEMLNMVPVWNQWYTIKIFQNFFL